MKVGTQRVFTAEEVAKHNTIEDLWIVVDDLVFDLSKFGKAHPGGAGILVTVAGQDATKEFYELHRKDVLKKYSKFVIGKVSGGKARKEEPLVSTIPYSEHNTNMGWKSPHYTDHHKRFLVACRTWLQNTLAPKLEPLEQSGRSVKKLYKMIGDQGLWAIRIGIGPHLKGLTVCGFPGEEMDTFHEKIAHEEFGRLGMPGAVDGVTAGNLIGTQPIMNFAKPSIRDRVCKEIYAGDKSTVLCITEPWVGSDVASMRTTAKKSPCGKYYIVNGIKKWITNGMFADYFTTAVRTGPPGSGMKGISMLLIEKCKEVSVKKIKSSYSPAAGTALVMFDNVKVPVENLLGKENQGFKVIVENFNHERWMIVTLMLGGTRRVIEECFRWANQRRVFGKSLMHQPVIRNKLGHMTSEVESVQAWQDQITYQMGWMNKKQKAKYLAGPIALLKLRATTVNDKVCQEAIQIFGGRAVTKNGMGGLIERYRGAAKIYSVYGGSEEIMADLGIRQSMKYIDPEAKL